MQNLHVVCDTNFYRLGTLHMQLRGTPTVQAKNAAGLRAAPGLSISTHILEQQLPLLSQLAPG